MEVIYQFKTKQIEQLHHLYQSEWWSKGRSLEETHRCIHGSQICIGILDKAETLVGFARVITDFTFKAFIFDVIVAKDHRASGVGKTLLDIIRSHQDLKYVQHLELYCLPELEAFYEKLGFSSKVGRVKLMRITR